MIKICKSDTEIAKYKEYSRYITQSELIPTLVLDQTLFTKAREQFAAGHILAGVQDSESKEILFYIRQEQDMVETAGGIKIDIHINFDGNSLLEEENLDTHLLEKADCFLFNELEEYTYALTEFIKSRYPEKRIFYADRKAEYFWKEDSRVTVLKSFYDINQYRQGRCMFIRSGIEWRDHIIPEGVSLLYNSSNVMNSLCWAKKIECFGTKNSERTILLIDPIFETGCGLAYIVRTVCCFVYMAHERDWIPVVNLTEKNMYIDSPQDNMWEQYFNQFSDISVQDALESQRVVSLKNNHMDGKAIYINPYVREIWGFTRKHPKVEFLDEIKRYFHMSMPEDIFSQRTRVFGAFVRGTDARNVPATGYEIDALVSACREIMEKKGFDKIFLATEDSAYFEAFKNEFGDSLLYIEQKRVISSGKWWESIGKLLDIKEGSKRSFGQTYLLVTYCLSQCEALAYNRQSGGYYLAEMWRGEPYRFSWLISE